MATQINNAAKQSILSEITEAIAAHPHATGIATAAIAAAVSEFYYGNALLTTAGAGIAGFLTGEAFARILARSQEIQAAAAAAKAAVENLSKAAEAAEDAKARALALEQELISAKALIAAMGAEAVALRQEFAAEAMAQAKFRQWTLDETAKAQAFAAEAQAQLKAAVEAAETPAVEETPKAKKVAKAA